MRQTPVVVTCHVVSLGYASPVARSVLPTLSQESYVWHPVMGGRTCAARLYIQYYKKMALQFALQLSPVVNYCADLSYVNDEVEQFFDTLPSLS